MCSIIMLTPNNIMPLLLIALSFGVGAALSWAVTRRAAHYDRDQVVYDARAAFAEELENEFV